MKPTSESTISNKFSNLDLLWPKIHMVARHSTVDSYTRMFHFKCTHNILYLNRQLYCMGFAESKLCSYCQAQNETVSHLFFDCPETKALWTQIQICLASLELPYISPVSAYTGLPLDSNALTQHLLLIFRMSLYKGRDKNSCNLQYFVNKVKQIRKIEKCITFSNHRKRLANLRKWSILPENF